MKHSFQGLQKKVLKAKNSGPGDVIREHQPFLSVHGCLSERADRNLNSLGDSEAEKPPTSVGSYHEGLRGTKQGDVEVVIARRLCQGGFHL